MRKKFLSVLLAAVMTASLIPTAVSGKESEKKTDVSKISMQAGNTRATSTITPSTKGEVYIGTGGTYTIKKGNYNTDNMNIIINTTQAVTLNVDGDITVTGEGQFIRIGGTNSNVTINGNNHKVNSTSTRELISNGNKAKLVFNGGNYEFSNNKSTGQMIWNENGGRICINNATFKNNSTNNGEAIFFNSDATLDFYSGKIEGISNSDYDTSCIYGGTINIYGGTISSQATEAAKAIAVQGKTVRFLGGKIINSGRGIFMCDITDQLMIGENAAFENNETDISLHDNKQFTILEKGDKYTNSEGSVQTISKEWENSVSVGIFDMKNNTKYQVITNKAQKKYASQITAAEKNVSVKYDDQGQYLYLWKHGHSWYSSNENGDEVTMKCTSDSECEYANGVTATLRATDMVYTGSVYDKAKLEDHISPIVGYKPDDIEYIGCDGTDYARSTTPPRNAGKYRAVVRVYLAYLAKNFEIKKADQSKPSVISTNETVKGKSDGTISKVTKEMEYSKDGKNYQSISETKLTGLKPGTYYVRYKETENKNASEAVKVVIAEGKNTTIQTIPKKIVDIGLKVSQSGNKLKVTYNKVKNASGYDVYVQNCQNKFTKKSLIQVKNGKTSGITVKKVNGKKLNPKNNFKVYIIAYQNVNGKKVTLVKSITAHVAGSKNKKQTNVKRVKVSKASYTLKKGKTAKIKAKAVLVNPKKKQLGNDHAKQFRYVTSNSKIATVSKTGKIKSVGKGTCDIYVYARNGCAKKVKVTVK